MANNLLDIFFKELNFPIRTGIDPLSKFILSIDGGGNSLYFLIYIYLLLCLSVFFLGYEIGVAKKRLVFLTIGTALVLFSALPGSEFILPIVAFNFLLFSLIRLRQKNSFVNIFLSILFSFYFFCVSGPLLIWSGVFLIFALEAVFLISLKKENTYGWKVSMAIIAFLSLIAILKLPKYEMPEYPEGARLVNISVRDFYDWPVIGDRLEPNPLINSVYMDFLSSISKFSLIIFALIIFVILFEKLFKKDNKVAIFSIVLMAAASIILLGEVLVEDASMINLMPFVALQRIIPGLALCPFPWAVLPFFFVLIYCFLFYSNLSKLSIINLVCFPIALLFCPKFKPLKFTSTEYYEISLSQNLQSRYLERVSGEWVSDPSNFLRDSKLRLLKPGQDFNWTVYASIKPEDAIKAVDGDFNTRWATGRPQERGDKFILKIDRPISLSRILLSVRNTPADYPRGVLVEMGSSPEELQTVINQPDWLGALRWTSQGFPYLGSQSEVILDFPRQDKVQYVVVTQIGQSEKFDWSINDIRLYVE